MASAASSSSCDTNYFVDAWSLALIYAGKMEVEPAGRAWNWKAIAKASAVSPLLVVLVFTVGRLGSALVKDILALFFVGTGSICGILALLSVPRHGRQGVLTPALVGLLFNGVLIVIFVSNFIGRREPSAWLTQRFPELAITVDFPGTPVLSSKQMTTALGPVTLHTHKVDTEAATFQLVTGAIDSAAMPSVVKATCRSLGVSEVQSIVATAGLPEGFECSGLREGGLVRLRAFYIKGQLVEVLSGATDQTSLLPQRFLNSVRAISE